MRWRDGLSYLRSTTLLRSNTPPSRGKSVLNTPFLDAGVPASSETRRMYGISAGGRRIYFKKIVNVAILIHSLNPDEPLDSYLGPHRAPMATRIHEWDLRRALSPTRKSQSPHRRGSWESWRWLAMSPRMRRGIHVCYSELSE
jgi:hypothetical protein